MQVVVVGVCALSDDNGRLFGVLVDVVWCELMLWLFLAVRCLSLFVV